MKPPGRLSEHSQNAPPEVCTVVQKNCATLCFGGTRFPNPCFGACRPRVRAASQTNLQISVQSNCTHCTHCTLETLILLYIVPRCTPLYSVVLRCTPLYPVVPRCTPLYLVVLSFSLYLLYSLYSAVPIVLVFVGWSQDQRNRCLVYARAAKEVVMRAAGCRDPDSLERRPSPSRTAPTSAQEPYPTL